MADNESVDDIVAKLDALEASYEADISRATAGLQAVRGAKAMLRPLTQEEPAEFTGKLADAIRTILRSSDKSFSPTEIRDRLAAIGYDKPHTNLMASIHSVLKRMEGSPAQEVKDKKRKDGTTAYYWVGERTMGDLVASMGGQIGGLAGLLDEQKIGGFLTDYRRQRQETESGLQSEAIKAVERVRKLPKP